MRSQKLETSLRLLTLQLESWKKLHDLVTYGLDKEKPIISSEQERQFTETRANLLQETEYIFRQLNILDGLSGKAMNVLQRTVSVRGLRDLTGEDVRRLGMEWNAVSTKLGTIQCPLKARGKQLGGQTAVAYYLGRLFRRPAIAA